MPPLVEMNTPAEFGLAMQACQPSTRPLRQLVVNPVLAFDEAVGPLEIVSNS